MTTQKLDNEDKKIFFPVLTFSDDRETKEYVIRMLGWDIDEEGYIIDPKTRNYIPSFKDEKCHIDEFGGIYNLDNQSHIIKDDIVELIEWMTYMEEERGYEFVLEGEGHKLTAKDIERAITS